MAVTDSKYSLATLAGGCFWCTEAVFKRLTGVKNVVPGYTGGSIKNPSYREVCSGRTGHAEAVQISFDPDAVSYEQLLAIFFATHDPTTLNRQGNDVGTQYRSAVFYHDAYQKELAWQVKERLEREKVFSCPLVTEIVAYEVFYPAEPEHVDYFDTHRQQPYCQFVIEPKIQELITHYTQQLKDKP